MTTKQRARNAVRPSSVAADILKPKPTPPTISHVETGQYAASVAFEETSAARRVLERQVFSCIQSVRELLGAVSPQSVMFPAIEEAQRQLSHAWILNDLLNRVELTSMQRDSRIAAAAMVFADKRFEETSRPLAKSQIVYDEPEGEIPF
jgi:hypothetical protein